jgi:hypothetical protein
LPLDGNKVADIACQMAAMLPILPPEGSKVADIGRQAATRLQIFAARGQQGCRYLPPGGNKVTYSSRQMTVHIFYSCFRNFPREGLKKEGFSNWKKTKLAPLSSPPWKKRNCSYEDLGSCCCCF